MAYRLRTLTNFVISIVLTGILLFVAFRGTDFSALWDIIQHVKFWWVLTAFPLLIFSHYIRAWRWQLLLVPVKNRVSRENAFSSLLIGYLSNNLIPRTGEIVRPYAMGKMENISKASTFGSVFLERMLDLISLMIGLWVLFFIFKQRLTEQFSWWGTLNVVAVILTIFFMLSIFLLLYRREFIFRAVKVFLFPFSERIKLRSEEIFHSFVDGMMIVRQRSNLFSIFLLTLIMWFLYVITAYLPLLAFDLGDASVDLFTGFVLTIVTSLSVIVPTPGATGSYHTFTVETLTRLYDIKREVALGYATLTHAVGYFSVIFVGLFCLYRSNIRLKDFFSQVDNNDRQAAESEQEMQSESQYTKAP